MPLVPFPGFVGGTFRGESPTVDAERTVNWLIERTESPTAQVPFPASILPTPGWSAFVFSLAGPIRGVWSQDDLTCCVAGDTFYVVNSDGTVVNKGLVAVDTNPASITSNGHGGHQVLVLSGGHGYIYDLNTGVLTLIGDASFPANALMCDFMDGYFLVLQANTSTVFLSALFDGTSWDATDVLQVSSSPDALVAIRVIQRTLWMIGTLRSEPWIDTGTSSIFGPIAGALVETGIAAIWSLTEADGSMFFVSRDERGAAMIVRSVGYQFQRVSTTSEERALAAQGSELANVRAYSYQDVGHVHVVFSTPIGATQVYDVATGLWHERGMWNETTQDFDPLYLHGHMYAFGKHLVGDRGIGTLYEQSLDFGSFNGTAIRRLRQCPHVNQSQQWIYGSQVTIGVETGVSELHPFGAFGLESDVSSSYLAENGDVFVAEGVAADTGPMLDLSYSKDGAHTWSTPVSKALGTAGDYSTFVTWHRTPGRFADLVLRVTTEATSPIRLRSCDLRLEAGMGLR